jgi:DNA recombination protein RmuC
VLTNILLGALILLVLALLILVLRVHLGKSSHSLSATSPSADFPALLANLAQTTQQINSQNAVLFEKVAHLEELGPVIHHLRVEMRGVAERASKIEGNQAQVAQYLSQVGTGLTKTGTMTQALVDSTAALHRELASAKSGLLELQSHAKSRQELEQRTAESIRRLELVIAGTQSKGVAGENLLDLVFSSLPSDWQVRNFQVNGKSCEFGLRLPNDLILPIDSKWTGTQILEQFASCEDLSERQKYKNQIEKAVLQKATEVRKYINTNLTVNFGVAVVPDAVYELCSSTTCEAFKLNIVIVSHSMFVPYLLLVFQTTLKTSQNVDLEKLDRDLRYASEVVRELEKEIEGRWSTAITMLTNGRDGMRANLNKLKQLPSLQMNALDVADHDPQS